MELLDIDSDTEDTFLRCLHDEIPADPRVIAMRREYLAINVPRGHRAKVLKDDAGRVVGLTNYIPIEYSPYVGQDLMAILCMWIHGYEHLVGNQQSKGYGRFMLSEIEQDARESGCNGICVWGKDFPYWNPISFYEHMGYEPVDQSGTDVLAWKRFNDQAEAPRFQTRSRPIARDSTKVHVRVVTNGWCGGGCQQCVAWRDAVEPIADKVELTEVFAPDEGPESGESIDVVYIDGRPDPHGDEPPRSTAEITQFLTRRYSAKRSG